MYINTEERNVAHKDVILSVENKGDHLINKH